MKLKVKSSGEYLNLLNTGESNGDIPCRKNTPNTLNFD